jgi:hypothetical protein
MIEAFMLPPDLEGMGAHGGRPEDKTGLDRVEDRAVAERVEAG